MTEQNSARSGPTNASEPYPLEGTVTLVTGSSRGIGSAIACTLARAGSAVAVHSLSSRDEGEAVAKEIQAIGRPSVYFEADVSDFTQVTKLVADVEARLGTIGIVVNNADWFVPKHFEEETADDWHKSFAVGALGVVHVVAAALPGMKRLGYGKIVNIAGDSGRVGLTGGVAHSGAMAAVIGMTKSWAREFAPTGIRVNAVSPGPIGDTRGRDRWKTSGFDARGEVTTYLGDGSPGDIAEAVLFMASPVSDYITGQTLSVNGGRAFPS